MKMAGVQNIPEVGEKYYNEVFGSPMHTSDTLKNDPAGKVPVRAHMRDLAYHIFKNGCSRPTDANGKPLTGTELRKHMSEQYRKSIAAKPTPIK